MRVGHPIPHNELNPAPVLAPPPEPQLCQNPELRNLDVRKGGVGPAQPPQCGAQQHLGQPP